MGPYCCICIQLTEGFQRFCAHYRFEAVFCNPYSEHGKGHVESKCGYAKRNWALPIPVYESHEQLVFRRPGPTRSRAFTLHQKDAAHRSMGNGSQVSANPAGKRI